MKRKDYKKPTMQVVECDSTADLLVASGVESLRSGYGSANSDVDDEEDFDEGTGTWLWN